MFYKGNALKCIDSTCTNTTMSGKTQSACTKAREITCQPMMGQLTPPDRCMVQKTKQTSTLGPGGNMTISMEVKNCSYSFMCPTMCSMVPQGTDCDVRCCEGDLCNSAVTLPTSKPEPKPTGPVGKDLQCYECGSTQGSPAASKCDNPVKRTCGMNPMGKPQDRCITVTAKVTSPEDGKLHDMVMRNCSSSFMCNPTMLCSSMPNATDCKVACCEGSLCNMEKSKVTPTVPSDSVQSMASAALVFLLVALFGRF